MRCVRASSPPWSASCWIVVASTRKKRAVGRCSNSSKAGTTRIADTRLSTTLRRRDIKWFTRMPHEIHPSRQQSTKTGQLQLPLSSPFAHRMRHDVRAGAAACACRTPDYEVQLDREEGQSVHTLTPVRDNKLNWFKAVNVESNLEGVLGTIRHECQSKVRLGSEGSSR